MTALVLPEAMYHWSITHILQYLILWGVHRRCITRFTKPMIRVLLLVIGPGFGSRGSICWSVVCSHSQHVGILVASVASVDEDQVCLCFDVWLL